MAGNSGGKNNDVDELMLFIAIFVLIFMLIMFLPRFQWIFFEYWRLSKITQFTLLSWIDMDYFKSMASVKNYLLTSDDFVNLKDKFPKGIEAEEMNKLNDSYWSYIKEVDGKFSRSLSIIAAGILAFLGIKSKRSTQSITDIYNFEHYLNKMSKFNYVYRDLLEGKTKKRFDTIEPDKSKEMGIIPMTPFEFATAINIPGVKEKGPIYDEEAMTFREELAKKAFEYQLGPKYHGVNSLDKDHRYIYEALKAILEKKTKMKAEDIMNKHAYVVTGLKSLYLETKSTGIYAPSKFRMRIKYKHPYTWRMLSDTGRLPMTLAGGIHAHHAQEKALGQPIQKPVIEGAVYALAETIGYDVEKLSGGSYYSKSEVNNKEK